MYNQNMTKLNKILLLYHPYMEGRALDMAGKIARKIEAEGIQCQLCSAWEEEKARTMIPGSSLLICIGGDGTVLRAVRVASIEAVPVLSINMGKLGFMTELEANEALDKLDLYLSGEKTWKDERSMLKSTVLRKGADREEFNALNDVLIARGAMPRTIQVKVRINEEDFTVYKGDGVLVSTATGSTGYALSLGGPILHPHSRDLLLKAVSPHLSFSAAVIFPADSIITFELCSELESIASMDGQIDRELRKGDRIIVQSSPFHTIFLRHNPPSFFYRTVLKKLTFKE